MKKKKEVTVNALNLSADELISRFYRSRKRFSAAVTCCVLLFLGISVPVIKSAFLLSNIGTDSSDVKITLASAPIAAATSRKDLISIPAGTVKANPFLPYRNIGDEQTHVVNDVPKFDLIEPPDMVNESSDAARVMDTVVSGILYDKYSPSAILNIEGNDYLVKKGDVVNNYKVVNILQDSVTVKLGNNTYKAGIGEILTEGSVNYNDVSNLSKKFGGERK